ncbi:unnamed protein product [Symbiodinium sp. CCMP2592]|nr:unnamed protein product [Symbiodinium sp. CCMP2592]
MCRGQLQTLEDGLLTTPTSGKRRKRPNRTRKKLPPRKKRVSLSGITNASTDAGASEPSDFQDVSDGDGNPEREQLEAMAYTVLSNNAWLLQHAQQLQCELQQERHQRLGIQEQLQATCTAWRTLHAQLWQENEGLKFVNRCQMQQLHHTNQQLEDCSMQCHQLQKWLIQMGQHHWQDARNQCSAASAIASEQILLCDEEAGCNALASDVETLPTVKCRKMMPRVAKDPVAAEGAPPTAAVLSRDDNPRRPRLSTGSNGSSTSAGSDSSGTTDSSTLLSAEVELQCHAEDEGRQLRDDRQALAKPEDAAKHVNAACLLDGDHCAVGGPSSETSTMTSAEAAIEGIEVGTGECTPRDLFVPDLLPYLSVRDLLNWRLLSRRTRGPKVLTEHVAEMGCLHRPEAVLAFVEKMEAIGSNPDTFRTSFEAAFDGDAEQQKFHECRWWCMKLASKRQTHFAESHVRRIVGNNLQSLLRHCRSEDADIAYAADLLVFNHAFGSLPFVQQPVAEAMLDLMEELVISNIPANLAKIENCISGLGLVLRSLCKPQRQKLAYLMVQLLMDESISDKTGLLWRLKLLWLADEDPTQTYAEAQQLLRSLEKSNTDLRAAVRVLMYCSCS